MFLSNSVIYRVASLLTPVPTCGYLDISLTCFLDDLPVPVIVEQNPERDWILIWKRIQSGVLSQEARSYLYLLAHERVGTRERGHRLMPGRFPSSRCLRCSLPDQDAFQEETILHRCIQCICVRDAWELLLYHFISLDISLDSSSS